MTIAIPEAAFLAMVKTSKDTTMARPLKVVPFKCVQNTMKRRSVPRSRSPTSTTQELLCAPPRKRSVNFASTKTVAKLYRSREDALQSWYQSSEYSAFDQERKRTVAALHKANGDLTCLDPTVYTVTGLEHHLYRQQMIERRYKTMSHVRSVLQQQHSNRYNGIDDPASLRYISELFSTQPSRRAHLRGVLDFNLNNMVR